MAIALKSVTIPDFGLPIAVPEIPAEIYEARARATYQRGGADWVVVYADREHLANIAFLTAFEPRFEEAILLLGPDDRRILVVGNESKDYAPLARLPGLEVLLCQTLSLMGQPRGDKPNLEAVLREAGIGASNSVGLVGWKYLGAEEFTGDHPTFQVSAFVVDTLRKILSDRTALSDVTHVLMHPESGLRATVDVHQIAAGEWGASRASAAVWRIVSGIAVGDDEFLSASRMGYAGEELNAHVMFASAEKGGTVVGLRSPRGRVLKEGDGVTTAVSYWGGLSSRAGLLSKGEDTFLDIAKAYFAGLLSWYDTIDIGVSGDVIHNTVVEALARGGLKPALNPGHLVGHDEWMHSPIRPGSSERIRSGMPFQVDIIPTPMPAGWALNNEDAVSFADEGLRAELARLYPEVWSRIQARRKFMAEVIGCELKPSILPISSTPLCLPPFWLTPDRLLVRD